MKQFESDYHKTGTKCEFVGSEITHLSTHYDMGVAMLIRKERNLLKSMYAFIIVFAYGEILLALGCKKISIALFCCPVVRLLLSNIADFSARLLLYIFDRRVDTNLAILAENFIPSDEYQREVVESLKDDAGQIIEWTNVCNQVIFLLYAHGVDMIGVFPKVALLTVLSDF